MMKVKSQEKLSLRQQQAQMTRMLIIDAAQELFLSQGYSNVTIEAIAGKAGVAVSTVYAVFGSKRGILRGIRENWHGHSHIREVAYGDHSGTHPEEGIEQLALATRRQWESGSDVIAIYTGASHADPEAAAELAESLAGRRKGMEAFARSMEPNLRPGLSAEKAKAILQALCLPQVFDELVSCSGWSADEYQVWLAGILKRELLQCAG